MNYLVSSPFKLYVQIVTVTDSLRIPWRVPLYVVAGWRSPLCNASWYMSVLLAELQELEDFAFLVNTAYTEK